MTTKGSGSGKEPPQQTSRGSGGSVFHSPLRYPGGKRKLANYLALIIRGNQLLDGEYAEIYAGGAAVALSLLYGEYVKRIHINDIDQGVHAFWRASRDNPTTLCDLIRKAPISVKEWERQRAIQDQAEPDPMELALSTFYLNRTNRSGIITGGLIGGKNQTGPWKIDARFNKEDLIRRIERVGRNKSRIEIHCLDGAAFLQEVVPSLPQRTLLYLDPPYYEKGVHDLYANYYKPRDHELIARLLRKVKQSWLLSYDASPEVRKLYTGQRSKTYRISYSANERYRGREILIFSPKLKIPRISDPARASDSLAGIRFK